MDPKTFIELENVCKQYKLESGANFTVLENINLRVDDGDAIALLGPSGSGKSTCLRIMAGLTDASSGRVLSHGIPLQGVNQEVALVFQSFAIFPWQTVYENIATALQPLQLNDTELHMRIKQAIDWVGLEGFEEAYPRELSGGMKQRVGIARALAMQRPVLFLDEPFSALDVLTADNLRNEIIDLLQTEKIHIQSMVLVTHNIQEAVFMAKRILIMGIKPGHIRTEIINPLPYPRDANTPAFAEIVSHIHHLITETFLPDAPIKQTTTSTTQEHTIEFLPSSSVSEVIGILESIDNLGGVLDVFQLSASLGKDFGRILTMLKTAELLGLVDTPKQQVLLTLEGKQFVQTDINGRKRMLHGLFGKLRLVQAITDLLKSSSDLRLPINSLEVQFHQWLPSENPKHISKALISWGRFAEYFGYNDNSKELYLDVGL